MSSPTRQSFFTLANLLSLSRLPLALLFAVALVAPWGGSGVATLVLGTAGLTDALDGMFARRAEARRTGGLARGTPAGTGSWLDPICDKLFVATVLLSIWFARQPPLTVLALILARELAQVPLSLIYVAIPALRRWLRYDFRASVFGKAATVLQFGAIAALVWSSASTTGLAWISFVVGLVALGDYLRRAIKLGRQRRSDGHLEPL
jgi:phosphatidylglycerophosphate synthase